MTKKLIVLGSINADYVLNLAQFPRPGETLSGSQYQVAFGGKGANQAVAAGRSGANIQFIAAVGDDEIGQKMCRQFKEDGIDTRSIETCQSEKTGVALIFVNGQGENMIGIYPGANAAVSVESVKKYQQDMIDADAILMQLETPLDTIMAAAQLAKQHGTQVILNPAPARELPDALLKCVDIITPNETEAEALTGIAVKDEASANQAAQALHQKGISLVIITLGSRGAWVSENGHGELIAGFKVNAVDTVAAGDTFNGMLVTMLLEGLPLKQAVRYGHAAAAIAVSRPGAQPSVPWRKEVDEFLASLPA